jgi:hypothetical protein
MWWIPLALLAHHRVLHEPRGDLEFAYFLNTGLISLVVAMEDGKPLLA